MQMHVEQMRFRTLALPEPLVEAARERARVSGISRNAVVLDALRRFLEVLKGSQDA
jgi:hypothetical protein